MRTPAPPSASLEQQLEMYLATPAAIIADTNLAASSFLSLMISSKLRPGCDAGVTTAATSSPLLVVVVSVREAGESVVLTISFDSDSDELLLTAGGSEIIMQKYVGVVARF